MTRLGGGWFRCSAAEPESPVMVLQNRRIGSESFWHIDGTSIELQQRCPNRSVIILNLDIFRNPDPIIGHNRDQSLIESSVVQRREA